MRARAIGTLSLAAVLAIAIATPVVAQSTGPVHEGYDPSAPAGGHYHRGELGEKLLVLETSLKCNCSCGLDVHTCQFQMQCDTSPVWSVRIREALEAGQDADVIQAGFVADFGGRVLMLPPPEGFNLVGYLLPAIAILTAGMLVGLVARGGTTREALAPVEQLTDEQAERLRSAMKKLDEAEGPDW